MLFERRAVAGRRGRSIGRLRFPADLARNFMKHFFLAVTILELSRSICISPMAKQSIDAKADFRGLCVVSPNVAWASGTVGDIRPNHRRRQELVGGNRPRRRNSTSARSRRLARRPPICSATPGPGDASPLQDNRRRQVVGTAIQERPIRPPFLMRSPFGTRRMAWHSGVSR